MKWKSRLWASLFLLCLSTVCLSGSAQQATNEQILETIAQASVRVYARGGSLGSGSVYAKNEDSVLILTNAHVAGGKGQSVNVEFWYQGRLSRKVPGRVVESLLNNSSDHDFAILEIKADALGSYFDIIEPIPLADADFDPDFSKIYSAGCPQGTWQTHWIGHGTQILGQNQAVKFVPMPANGRSGSAIYQYHEGKVVQVGLITYRTRSPGKDGASETDGEGIAQTISHIRKVTDKGQHTSTFADCVDDSQFELIPTQACPGGVCPTEPQSVLITGEQVERFSLLYVDQGAELRNSPESTPIDFLKLGPDLAAVPAPQSQYSQLFPSLPQKLEDCPDGNCAPTPIMPQESPQRGEIFPNLPLLKKAPPAPELDEPLPGEPEAKPQPREQKSPGPLERLTDPKPLFDQLGQKLDGSLGQLRKGQEENTGILRNIGERFDRRMDIVEQQLEIQRKQLQQSIAEGVENVEKGLVGRLLDLPLIRQVRWLIRVAFWPLVLFAIWWVPAFLLNLGPTWPVPIIQSLKTFAVSMWATFKAAIAKPPAPQVDQKTIAELVAEELRKARENQNG